MAGGADLHSLVKEYNVSHHPLLLTLTIWLWLTPSGDWAATDDPQRVPQAHKEDAVEMQLGPLEDWKGYTQVPQVDPQVSPAEPSSN